MISFTLFFVAFLAAVSAGLYFSQYRLIFAPSGLGAPLTFQIPAEEKAISYGHSQKIQAVFFRPEAARCRILYVRGYGGAMDFWSPIGEEMAQKLRCDLLMMDYPGFGKSSGGYFTGPAGLMASAEAGLAELQKDNHLPVIIYGVSLGSGIAAELAAHHPVAGLVLHSPYSNFRALMKAVMPWFPPFLLRFYFDTRANLPKVGAPVLILHGKRDPIIPFWQAQNLSRLSDSVELVTFESGEHTNLTGFPQYWSSLVAFTEKVAGHD